MGWYIPIFNPKVMCASLPWRGPAAARDSGDTIRYSCSCRARRGSRTRLTSYGLSGLGGLGGLGGLSTCTHHCTCIQAMLLILVVPRHHCIQSVTWPIPRMPHGPCRPSPLVFRWVLTEMELARHRMLDHSVNFPLNRRLQTWMDGRWGERIYIYIWYTIDGHRWIWWNHVESV